VTGAPGTTQMCKDLLHTLNKFAEIAANRFYSTELTESINLNGLDLHYSDNATRMKN